jgi:hypothetical protein
MTNKPVSSIDQLVEIPRRVWRRFVDSGGLVHMEPLEFLAPIKSVRLDMEEPQLAVDRQRNRYKRLISELFPVAEVEEFIVDRMARGNFPMISPYDMNEKFSHVLQQMISEHRRLSLEPFDVLTNRKDIKGRSGLFHKDEIYFAAQLVGARPAIILSVLFLRKFLVEFALLLQTAGKGDSTSGWNESLDFFVASWNQNTFISMLYPAVTLHMKPRIDLSRVSVDEPEFTTSLTSQIINWMVINGAFSSHANKMQHGHSSRMSCAATGFLVEGIGKRGWLNKVFEKTVEYQDDAVMIHDLKRIQKHAALLASLLPRPWRETAPKD